MDFMMFMMFMKFFKHFPNVLDVSDWFHNVTMLFSRESVEKVRLHWACACCMQGVSKKTMATGHAVIVKQDATKVNWARPHVICAHQASVVSFLFSVTFLKLQDLLTQLEKNVRFLWKKHVP